MLDRPRRGACGGAIFLAVLLTSFACDDDPTGPGPDDGEVGFSIDGDADGFSAAGDLRFDVEGRPLPRDWAVAADPDSVGGIVVTAFQLTEEVNGDLFILQLRPARTGTFSPCASDEECHGRLFRGWDTGDGGFDEWYEIVSGSVEVDDLADGHIAGSFSFTLRNEGGSGTETLVIEGGTFEVPIDDRAAGFLCNVEPSEGCLTEAD